MNRAFLLALCVSAVGCASSAAPRAAAPEPSSSSKPAPLASTGDDSAAECARLCKAYEHYRRGALLECDNGECGERRVHPETAKYGREMCDSVVAQCGSACPLAYRDHSSVKAKQ